MFQTRVKKQFKILDFDIECRPLSWYGGDWVTREITAIAAKVVGVPTTWVWLLGDEISPEDGLKGFVELYNEADMVTGHYIRGFDLPNINSALTEYGMRPLPSKLSQDTKLDLIKRQGMSNSQENLAAMLGVKAPKISMTQSDWREANRLTPEGLEKTKKRVVGDVIQHEEMRQKLLELRMLHAPRVWDSNSSAKVKYHA